MARLSLTLNPSYEDEDLLVYRTQPAPGRDLETESALGARLALVRATVTPTRTTQGGTLWVDLRWTSTYTPTGDYVARLALETQATTNRSGEIVQEETAPPCAAENWPTSRWGYPALAVDRRAMQVDAHLPPSTYQLVLSVAEAESGQPLPPRQVIATVEVAALERRFEAPPMQHPLAATFGQAVALLGYELDQGPHSIHLTLYWQAGRRLDYYKMFVHLYDAQTGALALQHDGVPRQWTYPTNWWEAGEVVSDEIALSLEGLPAGRYRLVVGVYDPDTLERLPVWAEEGTLLGDHLELKEAIPVPVP